MAIFKSKKKESLPSASPPLAAAAFPRVAPTPLARSYDPSTAPPSAGSPLSSSAPPSHTVLYPWAQRKLSLLPSALLDGEAGQPVWGAPSAPPFPRYGHSVNPVASVPGGDLYVFGGLVQNAVKNDLYVLSCAPTANGNLTVGLVETRGEVPGPRVGHASVGVGNVLIVWGGDTKAHPEDVQDDGLYLLNLTTREWTRVKTIGPTPVGRYGHAAAMVGSRFYVFGGQRDDGGFMHDLVWFDLAKLKAGSPKWNFVDYAPDAVAPPRRTGHTTVTHGDSIYVFGGTDGQYHYNDTWCYDTNTQLWTELSCIGYIPVPREGHAATLVDDVMYVFGGRGVDGKDLEDLAAFRISNQRWFMFQNMGPAPSGRSGHAMATWQNKVFVLGGESYTSQRADDPSYVHVLDTSKIKYPPDAVRPPAAIPRQSSIPLLSNSSPSSNAAPFSSFPPTVQLHPPTGPPLVSAPQSIEEDFPRRAISPASKLNAQGSGSPNYGDQSLENPLSNGAMARSALERRAVGDAVVPPPVRPARPEDSSLEYARLSESTDRAQSPFGSQPRPSLDQAGRVMTPTYPSPHGSPSSRLNASPPRANGATPPQATRAVQESARLSPSSRSVELADPNGASANGFYYGSRSTPASSVTPAPPHEALRAKDDEIGQLKTRENWMKATLAMATRRGFVPPVGGEQGGDELARSKGLVELHDGAEEGSHQQQVVEALIELRQELANAKTALAEQAELVNERVASASQSRLAALQEAAFYRAKLAALESGSTSEVTKLERERTLDLERKLAASLSAKAALESEVARLEGETGHHTEMRSAAEERGSSATTRAESAEKSYTRSLAEHVELQRQLQAHQSTIQDHVAQVAALTSSTQQLTVENVHLKARSETTDASVGKYVAALEATQLALAAATTRNDETHAIWQKSQAEVDEHQSKAQQLQTELDAKHAEATAATAKAADLERILHATREEHEATKVLAAGGLAELLVAHREAASRDTPTELQLERAKAVEAEAESYKQLHQDARTKLDQAVAELHDSRSREVELQTQIVALRSEVATLRDQHAQALSESGLHKSLATSRGADLRESTRTRETAEIRSTLLRNLMQEHGLAVNEDDLATRSAPLDGTETPEQLHHRLVDLEGRLEQRTRAHSELEVAHTDVRRQHQATSEQVEQLKAELQRVRSAGPGEGGPATVERAATAERSLEALSVRHRNLESTHIKAVQYVKGTEKMLRRMKEELTRYKERNEELEAEVAESDGALPADIKLELETLHRQLTDVRFTSEKTAADNEALQLQMAKLQDEHESQLHQRGTESSMKLMELEDELTRLDAELDRAHHDLEETHAVNNSLNKELRTALSSPTARSAGGIEAELAQAQAKSDWLKRENQQLEQRCRAAEEKISILLDHMEGASVEGGSDRCGDESPDVAKFDQHTAAIGQHWPRREANGAPSDEDASQYSGGHYGGHSRVHSGAPLP